MTNEEFIQSIALPGEEWRDVVGYEERYSVSSKGRIVTKAAPFLQGGIYCTPSPKLRKPRITQYGYQSITLSDGRKHLKNFLLHRVVATAFIENPQNLPCINHKDENPLNNNVENLEWCSHRYNANYGSHNARMSNTLRTTSPMRKKVVQLTKTDELICLHHSAADAARCMGVNESNIVRCCKGIAKTCKGFHWMYLSDYESLVNMSKNS